jgi:hypothetical protein
MNGELYFYVPPVHQLTLPCQNNTQVLGQYATKVDLENFVHGEEWERVMRQNADSDENMLVD